MRFDYDDYIETLMDAGWSMTEAIDEADKKLEEQAERMLVSQSAGL